MDSNSAPASPVEEITEDYQRQAVWLASQYLHNDASPLVPLLGAADRARNHLQEQLRTKVSPDEVLPSIRVSSSVPGIAGHQASSNESIKLPACTHCGSPLQVGWLGTRAVGTFSLSKKQKKQSRKTLPPKNALRVECGTCHTRHNFPGPPLKKKRRDAKKSDANTRILPPAANKSKKSKKGRRQGFSQKSLGLTLFLMTILSIACIPGASCFSVINREPLHAVSGEPKIGFQSSSADVATVGMYIHIPFCRRRCRYCDFAIVPIGEQSNADQNRAQQALFANYTHALVKEIEAINPPEGTLLETIYFGGGTPSLAPASMIRTVLEAVKRVFTLADTVEFTMEMDPGTFDKEKLQELRHLGVNRISLGVQSFDDRVLEYLGRFHRLSDIQRSLVFIADVFGNDCNYSLDLIAGLPGVSLADWCATLTTAVNLQPHPRHLSVYDLTIEDGTVFGKWYDDHGENYVPRISSTGESSVTPLSLPSPFESAFQYQYTAGYLRACGYEHYEVSSYALSGGRSKHNQLYWGYNTSWFAAGLGATSWVKKQLMARPRALADYAQWVEKIAEKVACSTDQENDEDKETEDPLLNELQDIVLKRLRTNDGLDMAYIRRNYGESYETAILEGAFLELQELVVYDPPRLRLLDSKGFMFSNTILSSIFVQLERLRSKKGIA